MCQVNRDLDKVFFHAPREVAYTFRASLTCSKSLEHLSISEKAQTQNLSKKNFKQWIWKDRREACKEVIQIPETFLCCPGVADTQRLQPKY